MIADRIEVRRYAKEGPNGDRDRERHPYFDYQVVGVRGKSEFIFKTFDGFDHYHTHILGDREDEAVKFAQELAIFLQVPWGPMVTFRKKIVQTEVWEAVDG